jgi:uncharacterized protein (DUF2267 family)
VGARAFRCVNAEAAATLPKVDCVDAILIYFFGSGEGVSFRDQFGPSDAPVEDLPMKGVREFDAAVHAAEEWIDELMRRLGWRDREKVCLALVATLHALRDSLPPHEAVFLGDHLTVLLRGLYYEGWRLAKYSAFKSRDAFLERIREGVHRDPGIEAEQVAHAVMTLIAEHLPPSELEDVRAVTPRELRAFWPA